MDTVKNHHTIEDIKRIKSILSYSKLLVRVNPWNINSKDEIERVINAGADIIMLPYWKTIDEVKYFIDTVNKRRKTTLLLETKEAVECIDDVLRFGGFDEIHIGLNDLHLSYGLTFMFELLTNGIVERLCKKFSEYGIPYGFGGIAKLGDGLIPAEKIIMEHYRLGSSRAILSRTFCDNAKIDSIMEIDRIFKENMLRLRSFEKSLLNISEEELLKNRKDVCIAVEKVVNIMKNKRSNNNV